MTAAIKRLLLAALLVAPAAAIDVADDLDTAQEHRYRALAAELRCLVCQNQSLADSNADLAGDMRGVVRQMIKDGESDDQIIKFMTDRYGDFVLYRPPMKPATVLLWVAPFMILCVGIAVVVLMTRRMKPTQLTDAERELAEDILKDR